MVVAYGEACAIGVSAPVIFWMRKTGRITLTPSEIERRHVIGSAMLGEGRWIVLIVVAGVFFGIFCETGWMIAPIRRSRLSSKPGFNPVEGSL